MPKDTKLDYYEAQEIAEAIFGIQNEDDDTQAVEEKLAEKWGVSLDAFHEIAEALFGMVDFGMSPLTQTPYVGISKGNEWLAKKDVEQQFIAALINWATEGEDIPKDKKGFVRTISVNGKPEFDITITRPKAGTDESKSGKK